MAENQEKKLKLVRNSDDIERLELGDVVRFTGGSRAVYYGKTLQSHIFLGIRNEGNAIYEIEVPRGHLVPMPSSSLGIGSVLSEKVYYPTSGISSYDFKKMILDQEGI